MSKAKLTEFLSRGRKSSKDIPRDTTKDYASRPEDGLKFEYYGERVNGVPHGRGICLFFDGGRYEGEMKDGKAEGHGTFVDVDGEVYDGSWRAGRRHGKGTWRDGKSVYEGEWRDDVREGRGVLVQERDVYDGEWKSGKRHGFGKLTYSDGKRFDGLFEEGRRVYGLLMYTDGSKYEGSFRDGKKHGRGTLVKPSGEVWEGEWRNGKKFIKSDADSGGNSDSTFSNSPLNTYSGRSATSAVSMTGSSDNAEVVTKSLPFSDVSVSKKESEYNAKRDRDSYVRDSKERPSFKEAERKARQEQEAKLILERAEKERAEAREMEKAAEREVERKQQQLLQQKAREEVRRKEEAMIAKRDEPKQTSSGVTPVAEPTPSDHIEGPSVSSQPARPLAVLDVREAETFVRKAASQRSSFQFLTHLEPVEVFVDDLCQKRGKEKADDHALSCSEELWEEADVLEKRLRSVRDSVRSAKPGTPADASTEHTIKELESQVDMLERRRVHQKDKLRTLTECLSPLHVVRADEGDPSSRFGAYELKRYKNLKDRVMTTMSGYFDRTQRALHAFVTALEEEERAAERCADIVDQASKLASTMVTLASAQIKEDLSEIASEESGSIAPKISDLQGECTEIKNVMTVNNLANRQKEQVAEYKQAQVDCIKAKAKLKIARIEGGGDHHEVHAIEKELTLARLRRDEARAEVERIARKMDSINSYDRAGIEPIVLDAANTPPQSERARGEDDDGMCRSSPGMNESIDLDDTMCEFSSPEKPASRPVAKRPETIPEENRPIFTESAREEIFESSRQPLAHPRSSSFSGQPSKVPAPPPPPPPPQSMVKEGERIEAAPDTARGRAHSMPVLGNAAQDLMGAIRRGVELRPVKEKESLPESMDDCMEDGDSVAGHASRPRVPSTPERQQNAHKSLLDAIKNGGTQLRRVSDAEKGSPSKKIKNPPRSSSPQALFRDALTRALASRRKDISCMSVDSTGGDFD